MMTWEEVIQLTRPGAIAFSVPVTVTPDSQVSYSEYVNRVNATEFHGYPAGTVRCFGVETKTAALTGMVLGIARLWFAYSDSLWPSDITPGQAEFNDLSR